MTTITHETIESLQNAYNNAVKEGKRISDIFMNSFRIYTTNGKYTSEFHQFKK
jgi:hypothetical protein